jgi:hypothetical protein
LHLSAALAEYEGAKLYEIKNFWDKVLDFNWHKQDKSPNWDTTASAEVKIVIG